MAGGSWTYPHRDLGEPRLPDGSPVLRPCVLVAPPGSDEVLLAVVDSGAPMTVADPLLLTALGLDLATAAPVMEVPLGLAGTFRRVPVFEVELDLLPPPGTGVGPYRWSLQVAVQSGWRLPFTVLLGHRGWFEHFATTINATESTVHLSR